MITFKIDILQALKDKGYSSATLRKDGILSESVITDIRKNRDNNEPLRMNLKAINTICELLKCQPGTIIKWIPDSENGSNQA